MSFCPNFPNSNVKTFFNLLNPLEKVMKRSGLKMKTFAHKGCKIAGKIYIYLKKKLMLPYLQDFFGIGATIRIVREMRDFFILLYIWVENELI